MLRNIYPPEQEVVGLGSLGVQLRIDRNIQLVDVGQEKHRVCEEKEGSIEFERIYLKYVFRI